jgi:predicted GIY-YIG superfamily endonuclease
MWTVYVLRSQYNGGLYIGMTCDLKRRLHEHNRGYNKSTKGKGPFDLLWSEQFPDREHARAREKYLKSVAGREWIKKTLVGSN